MLSTGRRHSRFPEAPSLQFAHVTTCSAKARGLSPDLSHIPASEYVSGHVRNIPWSRAEYTLREAASYYLSYLIHHDVGRSYDPVGSQFHGSIGAGMNPISSLYII